MNHSSNSGPKRTTEERAGRPENNYEAIRRIRKLDPMFDETASCRK